ncbi:MAG: APC family permease [Chloroflexi bacterium]|nr:APC family permease [Chloroflexota bacterium]
MLILAVAGSAAFAFAFPLVIGIVILLAILTLSYEQTIHAYPNGGGAYIVSRDNLGEIPAQIAAAALLTDYILTVAVSVSSGVAQLVSADARLFNLRAEIAVIMVIFIMIVNMRGVRESGLAFTAPTYLFVGTMYLTVIIGLIRYIGGDLGKVIDPPPLQVIQAAQGVTAFLILRAFANGTTALTGVEAISNGIPAFKEPRSSNAGKTLIAMAFILGSLMLGITFLATSIGAVPSIQETVISQLARTAFAGRGFLYLLTILGTTVILIMAANTSFADFPRLSALAAIDGFIPRQFAYRGSRLVYSRGIIALAGVASLLIIYFKADVSALIPLYAIGVFLSFTLSQAGMAHRWWKIGHMPLGQEIKERGSTLRYEKSWELKMVINGIGAVMTAMVTLVFAVTKFTQGAWVVIVVIPIMVLISSSIHRHYRTLAKGLSLDRFGPPAPITRHRVIIPISGVHRGTIAALRYAHTLSDDITAVHVSIDAEETEKIRAKWELWGEGYRLVILDSPFRTFLEPMLEYVEEIAEKRQPNDIITIVVPQFVPRHWWANVLHQQTAMTLRWALLFRKGIVVTDVPYQVD